jgi:hypothetical protein
MVVPPGEGRDGILSSRSWPTFGPDDARAVASALSVVVLATGKAPHHLEPGTMKKRAHNRLTGGLETHERPVFVGVFWSERRDSNPDRASLSTAVHRISFSETRKRAPAVAIVCGGLWGAIGHRNGHLGRGRLEQRRHTRRHSARVAAALGPERRYARRRVRCTRGLGASPLEVEVQLRPCPPCVHA